MVFSERTATRLNLIYELENPNDPNSAVLKDDGILIKEGSSLNLALRTELEFGLLGRDVEAGLRGLFEVAGEGEKVHQGTIDLETGGQLDLGLNWTDPRTIYCSSVG